MTPEQLPPGIPRPGERVADRFEIKRVLGSGGMGVVLEAHHEILNKPVALKFLRPEFAHRLESAGRFLREARATAGLKSEHVIRVLDADCNEQDIPFMVMEMLSGADLESVLDARGPLPFEEGVRYIIQACEGLAEAHAHGIVHRDLKPANLFLTQRADGSALVKVLDFGIAKDAMGVGGISTQTGAAMGSPKYMSPEQLQDAKSVDARTDIWALGVTLFQLFTGKTPFTAESLPELCVSIISKTPPSLGELRADAPDSLRRVVARCLEKEPARRYGDVAQLARDLSNLVPDEEASVRRIERIVGADAATLPVVPGVAVAMTADRTRPSTDATEAAVSVANARAPSANRRWLPIGAGIFALGMVTAIAIAWSNADRDVGSAQAEQPTSAAAIESPTVSPETVPSVEPSAASAANEPPAQPSASAAVPSLPALPTPPPINSPPIKPPPTKPPPTTGPVTAPDPLQDQY